MRRVNTRKNRRNKQGFTLIEVIVSSVVLSLVVVFVVQFTGFIYNSTDTAMAKSTLNAQGAKIVTAFETIDDPYLWQPEQIFDPTVADPVAPAPTALAETFETSSEQGATVNMSVNVDRDTSVSDGVVDILSFGGSANSIDGSTILGNVERVAMRGRRTFATPEIVEDVETAQTMQIKVTAIRYIQLDGDLVENTEVGTTSINEGNPVIWGSKPLLQATPNAGYEFIGWRDSEGNWLGYGYDSIVAPESIRRNTTFQAIFQAL